MSNDHAFYGRHVFGEMYGISRDLLDDVDLLEKLLREGVVASGATVMSVQREVFQPSGVTVLALLSESHASIHTYPEEGALFFDAFTCGTRCKPLLVSEALVAGLKPTEKSLQIVVRGGS